MTKSTSLEIFDAAASSSLFNLNEAEKQILLATPRTDDATFCCCSIINDTLQAHEHLDDCELLLAKQNDAHSDSSSSLEAVEPRSQAQKRRHRECVARIRRKLRASIASLQAEESQLDQALRHVLTSGSSVGMPSPPESVSSLETLRHAYRELVREQIELQDERDKLEASQASSEKFDRLVQRELEKAQTFQAN